MAVAAVPFPPPLAASWSWKPSQLTRLRVEHRAARLARVFRLDAAGRDDVRQQLWLRAVQAADRYQPGRGATLDHFIRLHLDYEYRSLRAELLAERSSGAFVEFDDEADWPSRVPDHRPSSDLRLDLEAVEQQLPHDLREVAVKLRSLTPAQIAAEHGVHRGTIYRKIALLRALLEEILEGDEISRDTPAQDAERYRRGTGAPKPVHPGATSAVRGRGRSVGTSRPNGGPRHG